MLIISNKGQTEALTHFTGYELTEEVNGALTLSLTSFSVDENAGHPLIEEEAVITAEGREFRIKQLKSTRNRKQITAISTFFDLSGHRKYDMYGGTHTFDEFATWLFAGSGWTYEAVGLSGSKLIPNFGNENFLKLMEVFLSTYECERLILPGNKIRFEKQIGPDNDAQYRYGHNIKTLSHNVDTTNLRTSIIGFGGNGLKVTYTSPNATKFPAAGEAEPVNDERYLIADSMLERLKQELIDVPEVSIELSALELTERELGERVWLIYEPLDIEFQTRILSKTTRIPQEKSSAVIGNAKRKSLTDQLTDTNVQIDENAKQTETQFDQTNEKIEIIAEEINGNLDEAKASWAVEASGIRGEVTSLKTYTDAQLGKVEERASSNFDILAGRITAKADYTQVTALGTRVNTVEFDMDAMEGQIAQKVSSTDFNGNTIASLINQTATTIDIQASKINLTGSVTVLSELSGDLGNITAGVITGTNFTLSQSGLLDLRLGTILWGTNKPQADYAENAGNANLLNGQYTYRSFALTGHVHQSNEYVKPYTGQTLFLWRSGNKVRVYMGADYVELTGTVGT